MTPSRRSLIQALGFAPVAAKSAAAELAALANSPAVATAMSVASAGQGGVPESPQGAITRALGQRMQFWRDLACEDFAARKSMRVAGLDPDIAALKSTSPGYRVRKQLERDASEQEFLQRALRTLWGEEV